jgi:hypothetical protein
LAAARPQRQWPSPDRTPFRHANPTGQNTDDAVAEPEHEEGVMQEGKKFEGVNP